MTDDEGKITAPVTDEELAEGVRLLTRLVKLTRQIHDRAPVDWHRSMLAVRESARGVVVEGVLQRDCPFCKRPWQQIATDVLDEAHHPGKWLG